MRSRLGLSSWRLELADGVLRLPPRNQAMRPANYEDRYDFQTVFYDVFWSHDGKTVIATAAPFLSLEDDLPLTATALPSGDPLEVTRHLNPNYTRLVLGPPAGTTGIQFACRLGRVVLAVQPSLAHVFRDRRVIYTLQQNNDLGWIRDWAYFYAREHGANAAIIYDNASARYEPGDVAHALEHAEGIDEVVVLDWPFPYGAFDMREDLSWNLIDSIYCQFAAFDHMHRRLAPLAASVLNADLDEIVIRKGSRTLFEAAEQAPGGFVQFEGFWVENVRAGGAPDHGPVRHRDYRYTAAPEPAVSEPKWAMAPGKLGPDAVLSVHDIHNAYPGPATDFRLYHFKGINTMWDSDRPLIGERRREELYEPGAGRHQPARDLVETFERVFGADPGYAAAVRPDTDAVAGHLARIRSGQARARGDTAAALAHAREALERLPDMQSFCEHLAALISETDGDPAEAETLRERAKTLREADFGFHLQRARRLFDTDDLDGATAAYRHCLTLCPDDPVALQGWLYCLAETEAFDEALAAADGAVTAAPEYTTVASLLPVYQALGRWREAQRLVAGALARQPDDPYLVALSASIATMLRQIPQAREAVERASEGITPAAFRERLAIVNRRGRPGREFAAWDPERGRLPHMAMQIARAEGRLAEAEERAREAAVRGYPFAPYELELATILDRRGKAEEAHEARARAVAIAEQRAAQRPPTHIGRHAGLRFNQRHLLSLIQVLIGSGETEQARAALDRARDAGCGTGAFLGAVAQFWHDAGVHEDAVKAAREAVAVSPGNARLAALLGRALASAGAFDDAIAALRDAIGKDPDQPRPWQWLAEAHRARGEVDEALATLRGALDADPLDPDVYPSFVDLLIESGKIDEAEAVARRAVAAHPDNVALGVGLARALAGTVALEAAVEIARATHRCTPSNAPAAATLASLLNRAGQHADAEAIAREATRLAGDDPRGWTALLDALLRQAKWEEARSVCEEWLVFAGDADRTRIHKQLVGLALRRGDLATASGHLDALDPSRDDEALRALRRTVRVRRLVADASPDAEAAIEEAIAAAPEDSGYRIMLAKFRADGGRLAEALDHADRAAAMAPDTASIQALRANILQRLGRHEDAEAALRIAIELSPHDAGLRVRLANDLFARGRRAEGAEALRAALALDPTNQAVAARLEHVDAGTP